MRYKVTHTTSYEYHQAVSLCHNIAKLQMRDTHQQHCTQSEVIITPVPDVMERYKDCYGNHLLYFAIQHEHKSLSVTVESIVQKNNDAAIVMDLYSNVSWEQAKKLILVRNNDNFFARQFVPFTDVTLATPEIAEYALLSFTEGRAVFDACNDLMKRIYHDFTFKSGFTTVSTPLSVVMKERKGVCQDFAHLAISCIRSIGLAAKYISGYLETRAPAGKEKLVGVDASHAWFAVYIPQVGWIEFDPTNNVLPGQQHLTIGYGRDYHDIAPLKGIIFSSGKQKLKVSVDVQRLA